MSLLALVLALLLEQLRPMDARRFPYDVFERFADTVARNFNGGRRGHGILGWMAAVLPWVLGANLVHALLREIQPTWTGGVLALGWSIAVLYATMGLRQFSHHFTAVREALRDGRPAEARDRIGRWAGQEAGEYTTQDIVKVAIEQGLSGAHRHVFGVITWFLVAEALFGSLPGVLGALLGGPGGAVFYRLTCALGDRWGRRPEDEMREFGGFVADLSRWIDWVPARLTALSFAIVGDFEDAIYCWRAQAAAWADPQQGIVLSSGAGAMGVRLGEAVHRDGQLVFRPELGLGDEADVEHLNGAIGLIWRAMILWILVIALMTLASLVS